MSIVVPLLNGAGSVMRGTLTVKVPPPSSVLAPAVSLQLPAASLAVTAPVAKSPSM